MGPGGERVRGDAKDDGHGPIANDRAKTAQIKKRGGVMSGNARRTVPGDMSNEDEDSAPIAAFLTTLSMDGTMSAVVSASPCAQDASRARLSARPSRNAVVG